uniref:Uncharacterized protein n=1 Tax=Meloidogyne enterolobii TaxID=390850 RepID=A0A6V7V8M8_MELEN|nr:unnamed protein product [Meloidogyne enterolobii]
MRQLSRQYLVFNIPLIIRHTLAQFITRFMKLNGTYSPKHTPNRYYEIHSKEDPYKPVKFWTPALKLVNFEGPTTRSIPLDDGKIGGSITTWQWTKASERHF